MRGSKAKRIRKMVRRFQPTEDALMGDKRTVRYFYRVPDYDQDGDIIGHHVDKSDADGHEAEDARPLFATYTLRYRPGGAREIYRRVKRRV